jgi:hypothetical protein
LKNARAIGRSAFPGTNRGTAITTGAGGFYSTPPNAPIEVQIRAAIPLDS